MGREVFVETGAAFGDALLDILVQSRDDGTDVLFTCGLVVSIEVCPDRRACLDVTKLQFHSHAGHLRGPRNFFEVIDTAVQEKISMDVASQRIDAAIMAGCT